MVWQVIENDEVNLLALNHFFIKVQCRKVGIKDLGINAPYVQIGLPFHYDLGGINKVS